MKYFYLILFGNLLLLTGSLFGYALIKSLYFVSIIISLISLIIIFLGSRYFTNEISDPKKKNILTLLILCQFISYTLILTNLALVGFFSAILFNSFFLKVYIEETEYK